MNQILEELSLQAKQRSAPPKKHGPASRKLRPSGESAPLSQPLYCLSTRPTSPPYPAPQLLSQPSPPTSPDPLACDLKLASVAVSAARRDSASSHPGRAYFSLPRRTCVCARHTAAPPEEIIYKKRLGVSKNAALSGNGAPAVVGNGAAAICLPSCSVRRATASTGVGGASPGAAAGPVGAKIQNLLAWLEGVGSTYPKSFSWVTSGGYTCQRQSDR
jgi:hypothetical protein